jgi:hypothetical protein
MEVFTVERREGNSYLEDLAVDGTIILKWRCMYWIALAQDRIRCRGLVNAVMNLRVS